MKKKESNATYYSALRNEKILPFTTTQMNIENILLSEIIQTEEDNLIYMWNL